MPDIRRTARWAGALVALYALWVVLDKNLERGLPGGIVILGLVTGSLYAINAIGLVLIYRANRVVNFAQAEFGSVAAVLAIQLSLHWKIPFLLAVVIGLASAALLGLTVESLVLRRFARSSRLILAVATIALAQILAGLSLIIPVLWDDAGTGTFAVPFTTRFEVFPVIFNSSHALTLVVVPIIVIALGAFLRFSDYGVAIRAAAENSERAGLLGVPVPRLSTIVWVVAAVLSATAVLLRATIVGYSSLGSASGAGTSLLLVLLAAAVIGRMENLPRTVLAAVALGVFEEAAVWTWSNTSIVYGMLIAVILVGLLAQRQAFSRATETGIQSWRALREVRPVPAELRDVPEVKYVFLALKVIIFGLGVTLPLWASPSQSGAIALVLIYSIVAVSLFVLTGWAGHISLGQFALAGFGGATTAVLAGRHEVEPFLALLAGVAVAGAVSLVLGLPALRVKGPFLAVTTLAFAVTSATYFLQNRYFPWFVESQVERPVFFDRIEVETDRAMYWFAFVALVIVLFGVSALRRSRTGRALIATRDNELAAEAVTLDTIKMKLTAFVISGMLAGLAGAVYVFHQRGLHTDSFGADVSIQLFSMVVIGGLGSLPGAVLGAMYVRGAQFFLHGGWSFVASGAGILVLLLFMPEGLGGVVYTVRDKYLRWVAKHRDLLVPSMVADRRELSGQSDRDRPEQPEIPQEQEVIA